MREVIDDSTGISNRVVVDWKGQPPTRGIQEHIDAMKAYVESAGGTPPQITSHPIAQALAMGLGRPLLTSSAINPETEVMQTIRPG